MITGLCDILQFVICNNAQPMLFHLHAAAAAAAAADHVDDVDATDGGLAAASSSGQPSPTMASSTPFIFVSVSLAETKGSRKPMIGEYRHFLAAPPADPLLLAADSLLRSRRYVSLRPFHLRLRYSTVDIKYTAFYLCLSSK